LEPGYDSWAEVVRAAKAWRQWSDDGGGYIEAEKDLAEAVDRL
jgi:hypothetical protein